MRGCRSTPDPAGRKRAAGQPWPGRPPGRRTGSAQLDVDLLGLGEGLQGAFEGELPTDAAGFVAAVGLSDHLAAALVDLDPAGFDPMRGVQGRSEIAGPHNLSIAVAPWSWSSDPAAMTAEEEKVTARSPRWATRVAFTLGFGHGRVT